MSASRFPRSRARFVALSLCLFTLACPIAPGPDAGVPDAGDALALPALDVTFAPCDTLAGQPDDRVACAEVEAPLDWREPERGSITLFVKRVRAREPSGRSLWILLGGPGQGGAGGEGIAAMIADEDPGLDVYLPDHRGTGLSTPLVCPFEESPASPGDAHILPEEWPTCRASLVLEHGDGLARFSTTQAAYDVRGLIEATRETGEQAFVLGISYGTYLANRYLQIAPEQPAGVVLDSLCTPGHCFISEQDVVENETARQILSRCALEPACHARLGDDPWASFAALHEKMAQGHCPLSISAEQSVELLRTLVGHMMVDAGLRRLVPAVLHRMDRCDAADQAVIEHLFATLFSPVPEHPYGTHPGDGYSFPLGVNISRSEMWESSEPGIDELEARWSETLSCRGVSRQSAYEAEGWPTYPEPLAGQIADIAVPVLAMNAALDPATPVEMARPFAERLTKPHQTYLELPGSAHTVIASGALPEQPGKTCGRSLMLQFLADPTAPLDTSCVDETHPLGFFVTDAFAELFFGVTDIWGDGEGQGD